MRREYTSQFASKFKITPERWVVSLMHTGEKTGGHVKIVVEGIKEVESKSDISQQLFVGEYHVQEIPNDQIKILREVAQLTKNNQTYFGQLKNFYRRITTNRSGQLLLTISERHGEQAYLGSRGNKGNYYRGATSRSWQVSRINAENMIRNITIQHNQQEQGVYASYQYYGWHSLFNTAPGDNCITWCLAKLMLAGVNSVDPKFFDKIKAVPYVHAHPVNSPVGRGGLFFLFSCLALWIQSTANMSKIMQLGAGCAMYMAHDAYCSHKMTGPLNALLLVLMVFSDDSPYFAMAWPSTLLLFSVLQLGIHYCSSSPTDTHQTQTDHRVRLTR